MKKVLLGLLALSAVSMAAPITNATMNAEGVNETSVFNQGDKGIVKVEGSMVSKVPVLKYVIYAGNAEGTIMEDELVLPDFILSNKIAEAGFDRTVVKNNVYVKKIIANGATEADTPTFGEFEEFETVKFTLKFDSYFSAMELGSEMQLNPTLFMTYSDIRAITTKIFGPEYSVDKQTGNVYLNGVGSPVLNLPNIIIEEVKNKGEVKFSSRTDSSKQMSQSFLNEFRRKVAFSSQVRIEAVVESI
ncbi:hypothetical protein [Cetobacterium somerae]|uniref:hypothetical protein n=1 Tax=Cetobacterium somerae TaxID=188913 RepID=UPI0038929751